MIAVASRAAAIPFFRFDSADAGDAQTLGFVSGGLILDSGEADPTFVYRCQDRYLSYTGLAGLRTVFLVADERHACDYRALVARHAACYALIAQRTGALPRDAMREPLYVACDLTAMRLRPCETFERQVAELDRSRPVQLQFNQISPTTARLAVQLADMLAARGVPTSFDRSACHAAGALALYFHDKSNAAAFVRGDAARALPPHVDTAFLTPAELLRVRSWDELAALYGVRSGDVWAPTTLFVKSSRDSGGNVAARLDAATFGERFRALRDAVAREVLGEGLDAPQCVAQLRAEIALAPSLRGRTYDDATLASYSCGRGARRGGITMLVQRAIARPPQHRRFGAIGVTYAIDGPDRVTPVAVAAQTYKDADRRHFLGSQLDDDLADVLPASLQISLERLCARFAGVGYRGPINFDACLDDDGRYVFIHDCNPRLSAVFPPLAVRAALGELGLACRRVLSLGYRGELACADLGALLTALDARNVLYTVERPHGVVVLPNLARDDGFDVLLVDVEDEDVPRLIAELRGVVRDAGAVAEGYFT